MNLSHESVDTRSVTAWAITTTLKERQRRESGGRSEETGQSLQHQSLGAGRQRLPLEVGGTDGDGLQRGAGNVQAGALAFARFATLLGVGSVIGARGFVVGTGSGIALDHRDFLSV